MTYQLTTDNTIKLLLENGSTLFLPAENNGTPEWGKYLEWVEAGNMPDPAPMVVPPAPLTTEQKLEAAGLTVAELKALFGLT
jgi:hypothetical protein